MKQQVTHWSIILDIIEAGLVKDAEKVGNYAELLAIRLEETGEVPIAKRIRRRLERAPSTNRAGLAGQNNMLSPQSVVSPVDSESRMAFVDEVQVVEDELLILPTIARTEVDRLVKLQSMADEFLRAGVPTPRSLLLYGPPGCGKSSTARYIALKLKLPLLMLRLDSVMSSYLGTTAKNLRSVFEYAARRGAVLFLDEFDAVAKMRDDANEVGEIKRIVNSLIQNLDAFPGLFVIAATNHEHLLDPAVWRRFDATIQLPLPGTSERLQLLMGFLQDVHDFTTEEWEALASLTEGLSGADISRVVIRARQEEILHGEMSLLTLLVQETWRQAIGRSNLLDTELDDKTELIRFIQSRTGGNLSVRTLGALAGVSHTTAARIRRNDEEFANHA